MAQILKNYSVTILEANSPKSSCLQGHALLKALSKNLLDAFLLASGVAWQSLAFFGL